MATTKRIKQQPRIVKAYSLDTKVVEELEELAAADNRSASNMVEVLLRRGVNEERKRLNLK